MNKNLFAVLILLLSTLSWSAANSISAECEQGVKDRYLVRGDWTSTHGGDRLWNFPRLEEAFNGENSGRCDREAFNQALLDSKEYWDHIAEKYHCPAEGRAVCESVVSNQSYITLAQHVYDTRLAEVDDTVLICSDPIPEAQPIVRAPRALARDVLPIVRRIATGPGSIAPQPSPCSNIPANWQRHPGDRGNLGVDAMSCLEGVVAGIFTNIKHLFESLWGALQLAGRMVAAYGRSMYAFMRAAWNGALPAFYAEQRAQGVNFLRNIANGLRSIPAMITQGAAAQVQQWSCLNEAGRTRYVCRALGYVGTEVLLAVLTGGASEARLALRAVRPLETVLSIAAPTTRVIGRGERAASAGATAERIGSAGARGSAQAVKSALRSSLTAGQRIPSEVLGGRVIANLTQGEARALVQSMAGGSDRAARIRFLRKIHPDTALHGVEGAAPMLNRETAIFNDLVRRAAF